MKSCILSMVAGLVLPVVAGSVRANEGVYRDALRSTVLVLAKPKPNSINIGSGVLISRDGKLLLTNHHVVGNADIVQVCFPLYNREGEVMTDLKPYVGSEITGRVLARDRARDLALIVLEDIPEGVQPVRLASTSASGGQTVHGVGNSSAARGALWRYARGTIHQVSRDSLVEGLPAIRLIEMDARIDGGDSGGPIVNNRGELVGIMVARDQQDRRGAFGIDREEIAGFVADVARAQKRAAEKARPSYPLAGAWYALHTDAAGRKMGDIMIFAPNGRCVWIHVEAGLEKVILEGRYTLKGDQLILQADDSEPVSGKFLPEGRDSFRLEMTRDGRDYRVFNRAKDR